MKRSLDMTTKFHNMLQALSSKKAKHICMYPDCAMQAINSHAISKENSLRFISNNGELISPEFIRDDNGFYKEIKFKKNGVKQATTFKGFCLKHDAIFNALDTRGLITIGDFFLQLYRSFASFIFEDTIYRESARHAGDHENFNPEHEKAKLLSADLSLALAYDLIDGYETANEPLPEGDSIILEPYSQNYGIDASVIIRRLTFDCPVALQKRFCLHEDGDYFDTFVFVIPGREHSTLIVVTKDIHLNALYSKVCSDIKALNFIEACMINDGHWWLSPTVFNSWPAEKLTCLESDYWNFHERKYLEDYDLSLFDSARRAICSKLDSKTRIRELEKIDRIPAREPEIIRRLGFSIRSENDKRRVTSAHPGKPD
ncbi:hypothetical protein [Pseudomonas sp. TWI628]|uniref:hypothetical protein n=1 Tax=Pseudomonas sp. TWI628 TaxID=3136788 RepID=UPI003209C591